MTEEDERELGRRVDNYLAIRETLQKHEEQWMKDFKPAEERWPGEMLFDGDTYIGTEAVGKPITVDDIRKAVSAADKITEDYRTKVAETFLSGGITLYPSDTLKDNEYMVSRAVYEAAKKLPKGA